MKIFILIYLFSISIFSGDNNYSNCKPGSELIEQDIIPSYQIEGRIEQENDIMAGFTGTFNPCSDSVELTISLKIPDRSKISRRPIYSNNIDSAGSKTANNRFPKFATQFNFSPLDVHMDWDNYDDKAGNSFAFNFLMQLSPRVEAGIGFSECIVDAYSGATFTSTGQTFTAQLNLLLATGSVRPYAGLMIGHGSFDDGDGGSNSGVQLGAQVGMYKQFKSGIRIGGSFLVIKQPEKAWGGTMISIPLYIGFQFKP